MSKHKVLIADDEESIRIFCSEALKLHPAIEVYTASDGLEALHFLENEPIKLLITDLKMPNMDGYQLLSSMIDKEIKPSVIVMTSIPEHEFADNVDFLYDYIEKPIDIQQMMSRVNDVIYSESVISKINLASYLQILRNEKKTCRLNLFYKYQIGYFTFNAGTVSDAACGELVGDEAVLEMLSWDEPTVSIQPIDTFGPDTVQSNLSYLMIEHAKKIYNKYYNIDDRIVKDIIKLDDDTEFSLKYSNSSKNVRFTRSLNLISSAKTVSLYSAPDLLPDAVREDNPDRKELNMSSILKSLEEGMKIEGAIGIAIADWKNGLSLGCLGGGTAIDIDLAASANCQVVRAKMEAMKVLNINGGIQDILITLDDQIHLIRPLKKYDGIFLYLAADKTKGNLGLARHKLQQIEANLEL